MCYIQPIYLYDYQIICIVRGKHQHISVIQTVSMVHSYLIQIIKTIEIGESPVKKANWGRYTVVWQELRLSWCKPCGSTIFPLGCSCLEIAHTLPG